MLQVTHLGCLPEGLPTAWGIKCCPSAWHVFVHPFHVSILRLSIIRLCIYPPTHPPIPPSTHQTIRPLVFFILSVVWLALCQVQG